MQGGHLRRKVQNKKRKNLTSCCFQKVYRVELPEYSTMCYNNLKKKYFFIILLIQLMLTQKFKKLQWNFLKKSKRGTISVLYATFLRAKTILYYVYFSKTYWNCLLTPLTYFRFHSKFSGFGGAFVCN